MDKMQQPPKWFDRFLEWYCRKDKLEQIQGDLHEMFYWRLSRSGGSHAKRRFAWDVIRCFRWSNIKKTKLKTTGQMSILNNYMKTSMRSLVKRKGYSLINIFGLTFGLATCIMIMLWAQDEFAVNAFHEKGDRLYQVMRNVHSEGGDINTVVDLPGPLNDVLKEEYPEVEGVTMLSWLHINLISNGKLTLRDRGRFASPNFFETFSYPLLVGKASDVLTDPNAIVLSKSLAESFLGTDWKALVENGDATIRFNDHEDLAVTGVFDNTGLKSDLDFNYVYAIEPFMEQARWTQNWDAYGFRYYIVLKDQANVGDVNQRISGELNKRVEHLDSRLFAQLFKDRYLNGKYEGGEVAGGRIYYVKIFIGVGIFILIMACVNFMNLATATSTKRTKEIGVRKALGALKGSLRYQFLIESMLLSGASALLALLVAHLALPAFNMLTGKALFIDWLDFKLWLGLVGFGLGTGLLAGSYPAFVLSTFKAVDVIKGGNAMPLGSNMLRKSLVVFQFGLSVVLVALAITVHQQINYILTKDLGADRENIIYTSLDRSVWVQYETYRAEMLAIPGVTHVTSSSHSPLSADYETNIPTWEGKQENQSINFKSINANYDWIETMGVTLLAGKGYSKDNGTDNTHYIINERAADLMGFEDPIGKKFSIYGIDGEIVGLVKDFHMTSMYNEIEPLVICFEPRITWQNFIRMEGDIPTVLEKVEAVQKKFEPNIPFSYNFMDDSYEAKYKNEMVIGTLADYFALIAIAISCLGLLGLASFNAEQRAKELGVRKVLGASAQRLVLMLSGSYVKLALLALVVSLPVAYWLATSWLDAFAYKISIDWTIFGLTTLAVLGTTYLTVGVKAYQASNTNPTKVLRDE